jgi:trans-2-enoyl-CoA reductase
MLSDFVALKPGDVILQNGATSGVGKAVIQIAKARGVKTINIVRDRPDFAQTRLELMCLGADVVVTEAALRNRTEMAAALSAAGCDESKPRLALNCVGGTLVGDMIRHMGHAASVVTYGGMSKKPISVGTGTCTLRHSCFPSFSSVVIPHCSISRSPSIPDLHPSAQALSSSTTSLSAASG